LRCGAGAGERAARGAQSSSCNGRVAAAADRRARHSANGCADCGGIQAGIGAGLVGRLAAALRLRELAAFEVVGSKLVETFAGSREHHHVRTAWRRGATGERQHCYCQNDSDHLSSKAAPALAPSRRRIA
jgi:hypothetical protein